MLDERRGKRAALLALADNLRADFAAMKTIETALLVNRAVNAGQIRARKRVLLTSKDREAIIGGLHRLSRAGDRQIKTLKDVMPEGLMRHAERIVADQWGPVRLLRLEVHTRAEIAAEVNLWCRQNAERPCTWHGCTNVARGNYRFCNKHRAEINEIARGIQ